MNRVSKSNIAGALIGIAGISLVISYSNWQVGLGIFILMYGDNLSKA